MTNERAHTIASLRNILSSTAVLLERIRVAVRETEVLEVLDWERIFNGDLESNEAQEARAPATAISKAQRDLQKARYYLMEALESLEQAGEVARPQGDASQ